MSIGKIREIIFSTSKFGGHHPLWMTPLALQGLEVNEAYETHAVMKSHVAYSTNTELKHTRFIIGIKIMNAPSSNLDLERDETYTSTENLLDPAHGVAVAYATVGELEPYATVTTTSTVTKGNGEEYVTREEELVENESYGSAIVAEKNEASKPESSSGAVDEYADYHTYDSIYSYCYSHNFIVYFRIRCLINMEYHVLEVHHAYTNRLP